MEEPISPTLQEKSVPWAELANAAEPWFWKDGKLMHRRAASSPTLSAPSSLLRNVLVRHVYATQDSSPAVKRTIESLLSKLPSDEWGLNLGAGGTRLHPRLLNLDIVDAPGIDIVTSGQDLPFKDRSLGLIISQEVLEHLPDPAHTVAEAARVLKPGGRFYCQTPFIIGFHPGPMDFWRFTRQGIQQLFRGPGWIIEDLDISLGHGSGFYRIAVEYFAVNFSLVSQRLYLPAKGFASVALLPLKWPDLLSHRSPQKDRIPGGYFCVARKL